MQKVVRRLEWGVGGVYRAIAEQGTLAQQVGVQSPVLHDKEKKWLTQNNSSPLCSKPGETNTILPRAVSWLFILSQTLEE